MADKLPQLFTMLQRSPKDTFLLYGIGMEYKEQGELVKAIDYFNQTIAIDPGYCYAYYQRGQTQEEGGDPAAAKSSYRDGIAAADRVGDAHARSELQTALGMLD